ncbi:glycine-rich domain-containing protein [Pseudoduganella lutea]|uniref:Glycine-rich domain-containing protein-like n=1 Tax=Pseudoduganella lutea TaxID=321985 RepID=A0A4P6KVJ5_9BURK|nr:hypothetical protein [Pseudoduganella lutea]QBE62685.1 hypothetical protein EWM63_06630 [Pseudoduganella lutea]
MVSTEHFKQIAELDLEPIKVKLMHEESGEGWSLEKADAVEFEYRRFLYLMKMFPNEQTAPLMDVDTFWHYHILDTMKYAVDCDKVFGYFLHHFPYIGLRGEDDEEAHRRVGDRMKELYEETFGDAYLRNAEPAYSGRISANSAYSGRIGTDVAYSGRIGTDTAYSGRISAQTAYSGRIGTDVAYSGRISTDTAYSGRVAYSGRATAPTVAAQTAYSGRISDANVSPKTAYSGRIGTETAYSGRIDAAPAQTAFYTERPRLA